MNVTMTYVTVAAQPGWFLTVFTSNGGIDRYEPIIAWEIKETNGPTDFVTRLPTRSSLGNSKNKTAQRTCNQISDPNHGGKQEHGSRLRYLGHQTAGW